MPLKTASSSLDKTVHLSTETPTYFNLIYEGIVLDLNQSGEWEKAEHKLYAAKSGVEYFA